MAGALFPILFSMPIQSSVRAETPPHAAETGAGWVKYEGNPVLGGEYGTCFDISVLHDLGIYRMWVSWRPKHNSAPAIGRLRGRLPGL